MSACANFFPPQVVRSEPRPWQTEEVRACVKDMWQAYHAMKRVALEYPTQHIPVKFRPITFHLTSQTTLNTSECLEATSQMATMWQDEKSLLLRSFKALHLCATSYKQKVLRQRGQEKRTAKIPSILDAAQSAAAGDMRKLYTRRFVNCPPKNPKERIQIRGPDNRTLSRASEHAEIVQHFSSVFTRRAPADATPWLASHLPISVEEIRCGSNRPQRQCHLGSSRQRFGKTWKDLMPYIVGMINTYLAPGVLDLPDSWTDSWLCLLPKPHKPANAPKNLRPIVLQCPPGLQASVSPESSSKNFLMATSPTLIIYLSTLACQPESKRIGCHQPSVPSLEPCSKHREF